MDKSCPNCGEPLHFTLEQDNNYGADADGRRGILVQEVTEAWCFNCKEDFSELFADNFNELAEEYFEEPDLDEPYDDLPF